MDPKPWSGTVPAEDVASFRPIGDPDERPLTAGSRPALGIVDMTRAFVDSAYPPGWSPTGGPAVEANAELLQAFRAGGLPVYFTKAFADPLATPTPGERGRWKSAARPPADPSLPPGDVIVDALTPQPGEVVINKGGKPSGFFGTPLASLLIHERVDTVVVTGMTTSGCVRATALDAFQHNYHVVIPHECSADRSQLSHKVSLFDLHMKYADVVSLREAVSWVGALTGAVPALA